LEEGISSPDIGVRSLEYMTSKWGVPKVDCKGFNDVIGLPNSEDLFSPGALGISRGVVDDKGGVIQLDFERVSSLTSVSNSECSICEDFSFCEGASTFFGFSSTIPLSRASDPKSRGILS
jgi:hypothetical protein